VYRTVTLALQVRHEPSQVERNWYVEFLDDGGMPPFHACAKHRLPQHAYKIARPRGPMQS
jgi:hypothetical protein